MPPAAANAETRWLSSRVGSRWSLSGCHCLVSCGWFVLGCPWSMAVGRGAQLDLDSSDDLVGRQSIPVVQCREGAGGEELVRQPGGGAPPALSSKGQGGGHGFGEAANDRVVLEGDDKPVGVGDPQDGLPV